MNVRIRLAIKEPFSLETNGAQDKAKEKKMQDCFSQANMDFKWILNWGIDNIDQMGKNTDWMGCVSLKNTKIYLQNRSFATRMDGDFATSIGIKQQKRIFLSKGFISLLPNTGADAMINSSSLCFDPNPSRFCDLQFLLLCNYASTTIPINVMKCEMNNPYFTCRNTQKQIFAWVASLFSFLS